MPEEHMLLILTATLLALVLICQRIRSRWSGRFSLTFYPWQITSYTTRRILIFRACGDAVFLSIAIGITMVLVSRIIYFSASSIGLLCALTLTSMPLQYWIMRRLYGTAEVSEESPAHRSLVHNEKRSESDFSAMLSSVSYYFLLGTFMGLVIIFD